VAKQKIIPPSPSWDKRTSKIAQKESQAGYWIYGHHALQGCLKHSPRRIQRALFLKGKEKEYIDFIPKGIPLEIVDEGFFQKTFGDGHVHQGAAFWVLPPETQNFDDYLNNLFHEDQLLVCLDHVTDPHNLGAIIRSAAAFGVHGLIVPKHDSAPLHSPIVAKTASGGIEHIPLFQVTNIPQALQKAQKNNFWSFGLDERGTQSLPETHFKGHAIIVMGAEGSGLRRLTAETCDFLVSLPTSQKFSTLNVSNAAAVTIYEVIRQKGMANHDG
jgi:23S rRNA (guanosine2251-2'-O)-methyltransferase